MNLGPRKLTTNMFWSISKPYTEHEVTLPRFNRALANSQTAIFSLQKKDEPTCIPATKKRAYKHVTSGNVLFLHISVAHYYSSWHPFTSFDLCGAPPSFHHTAAAATFGRANHTLKSQSGGLGMGKKIFRSEDCGYVSHCIPHLPVPLILEPKVDIFTWYIRWQLGAWFQIYRELEDHMTSIL